VREYFATQKLADSLETHADEEEEAPVPMPNQIYLVHWSSYIPAHSEKDAARQALAIQREFAELTFDVQSPQDQEQGTHTTIDLSDGVQAQEELKEAREAISDLRSELIDGVKAYFDCAEAKIDEAGSIWIARPHYGHWIGDDDIIAFYKAWQTAFSEWLKTRYGK
jgi:hypothetical protein